MSQRLRAIFQDGCFVPRERCDIPEGVEVEITVEAPSLLPPRVTDPEKRKRILSAMVERMQQNPLPGIAPPLSRDELHERR